MDKYEIQETPILGLYELAKLDPIPLDKYNLEYSIQGVGDPRVLNVIRYLGLESSCIRRNWSQIMEEMRHNMNWHTDGLGILNGSHFVFTHMIMSVSAEVNTQGNGTVFKSEDKLFQASPWRVYLIPRTLEHRTPNPNIGLRFITRFDITEEGITSLWRKW